MKKPKEHQTRYDFGNLDQLLLLLLLTGEIGSKKMNLWQLIIILCKWIFIYFI
jgi:hypothetical protein